MSVFSPSKTWEGVAGAMLFSVLTGIMFALLNSHDVLVLGDVHPFHIIFMSSLIGVSSIFGDLIESFIKRCADVKDAGTRLPGHGGFLDRVIF